MHKCYGCGRVTTTCWIMPCLILEIALAKGTKAVKAWGVKCGLTLR